MRRLLVSGLFLGLLTSAQAAEEQPIQPDEGAAIIPPGESAIFSGTAYPIPISKLPAFDKKAHGWKCTMLGSDGFKVTTPGGRKNPVQQGLTTRMGVRVDIWVATDTLFLKYADMAHPIGHVIFTKDHDFLSGLIHLSDAVRGSSTIALDQKTGLLTVTMVMWSPKEKSTLSTTSLFLCR